MKPLQILLVSFVALGLLPRAWGQDDVAKQQLVKALKNLQAAEVAMAGSVSEELPDSDKNSPAAGVQRVVISSINGGGGNPFLGDFELMINKDLLAIVSKQEFPGIKTLQAGDKVVNMQLHTEDPFSIQPFSTVVKQLLDWQALSEAVDKATKVRVTETEGGNSIRVVLESDLIPVDSIESKIAKRMAGAGGAGNVAVQVGASSMSPRVVDLAASFSLNQSGSITGMKFDIQYSDPMKAMMANAMRGGGGIAAFRLGGNAPRPKEGDDAELGKLMTYSFKVSNETSPQVKEFVKMAKPYLESIK